MLTKQSNQFLAKCRADVLDVIVESCTQRKPAKVIHEQGVIDVTFSSASIDAIWFMNSEPNGDIVTSISPCSVAFVARQRPCFFLSQLYVSYASKMFVQIPDRIAVVERREARRFPVLEDLDVQMTIDTDCEMKMPVRAIDISANGILIEHDDGMHLEMEKGMRANVYLNLNGVTAEISGMVRRRAGTNRYGIAFPIWLSREHLSPSHPFLRILGTIERYWNDRQPAAESALHPIEQD